MHVLINLCGVEDSVENYQTYLNSSCAVMVYESNGILFFSFCHSYLDLRLKYAFIHILFSLRTLLLAVEMSDRKAFRSQARQIAAMHPT